MTSIFGSGPHHQDGHYHPALFLKEASDFGWCAVAAEDIPKDTEVVSCAYDFAITPSLARDLLQSEQLSLTLNDRQITAAFLLLCRHDPSNKPQLRQTLQRWRNYVHLLPSADHMRTPLFFTRAEMELLKGTNMPGAVHERLELWQREYDELRPGLQTLGLGTLSL